MQEMLASTQEKWVSTAAKSASTLVKSLSLRDGLAMWVSSWVMLENRMERLGCMKAT